MPDFIDTTADIIAANSEKIRNKVIESDKVEIPKQSIYANFLDKVENNPDNNLSEELEKEVYRNITSFQAGVATKRIMELIWVTRYEW